MTLRHLAECHITCREISPAAFCTVEFAAAIFPTHPSDREGNTWFPKAFGKVTAFANVPKSSSIPRFPRNYANTIGSHHRIQAPHVDNLKT